MSADNFNKKPDNSINQDEELTAILQRLSSLLDKSVSLDEAIELAKQQSNNNSAEESEQTEQPQETAEQDTVAIEQNEDYPVSDITSDAAANETSLQNALDEKEPISLESEEIDAYAELIEKKRAQTIETMPNEEKTKEVVVEPEETIDAAEEPIVAAVEPIVAAEEPIDAAEEPIVETEEPIVETEEPIVAAEEPIVAAEEPIVEAEEPIVAAEEPIVAAEEPIVAAEENTQTDKSMPVSDFIKLLKTKRFTEQDDSSEETEPITENTPIEEYIEEAPTEEITEEPIEENTVTKQAIPSEDETTTETAPIEEEVVFNDENDLIIEKKPLFDKSAETQENTIEDSVTSKIFDEILACFDERNISSELPSSDAQPTETPEDIENVSESETETDNVSDEEQEYEESEEETEEEPIPEFVPIEHESPEEDELFAKLFAEEKSERKNRERDKKKWQAPGDAPSPFLSGLYDWLEVIVLSAAFALLLFTFILRLAIVDGDSMNHTLHDKEMLIISDLMYTPENNDIIVFTSPNYPEPIVKRIIATEGQTVDIDFDTWTVKVDGKVVKEDYINRVPGVMKSADVAFPLTVPEGYIFVMGDNRNDSLDSRNSRIGFVDERFILGEVKLRIFPFGRFGIVD